MKITVTQEDINLGKRRDGWHCPIALACQRIYQKSFMIDFRSAYNNKEMTFKVFDLPQEAQEFVKRFDNRDEVQPFTFETIDPTGH